MDKEGQSESTARFNEKFYTRLKRERSSESNRGHETEYVFITRIRTVGVTILLRRIPIGFYVSINCENVTKETSNKPAQVGKDTVEWDDDIVLSSNRLSRVSLKIFASFELGPRLGEGELLDEFETTVGELLDRNGRLESVRFVDQGDGEVISLRSFLEVEIERRVRDQEVNDAASNPEPDRLGEITNRGHHALIRYRELQEQQDLCSAVNHFKNALDLCPLDHPSRASVLSNLAASFLMNCRVNDLSPDFDVPINLYRDSLRLRTHSHPDRPFTLLSLGVALQARFQRNGDEADESEGRTLLSRALDIAPANSHVYHAAFLALHSTANLELIQSTMDPKTMEDEVDDESVHRLDAALQWMFYPDSCKRSLLDHLGVLFCIRFDRLGDLADREQAISVLGFVLRSASANHLDRSSWMDYLGDSFSTRYMLSGDLGDLEESISWRSNALQITPDAHPERPARQSDLGYSLLTRYERSGDDRDLRRSISLFEHAVESTPDGDPDKPSWLGNMAEGLLARYERFGKEADLQKSISTFEVVVQSTHDDHPQRASRLHNLSMALLKRYRRFGSADDLERSISGKEKALELTADDHPDRAPLLSGLSNSLWARYELLGHITDLEESISMSEGAIELAPEDHPDKSAWLNNLGGLWLARHTRFGDLADLDKSISNKEDALRIAPDDLPDRPAWLSNLGGSLLARYHRLGDVLDLERSISSSKTAVRLTPVDHPDRPAWLSNLGNCLLSRFERFGDLEDLENSIAMKEEAVQSLSDNLDKSLWKNNLGDSLLIRYERTGAFHDLERSVSMFDDAVESTPDGHPDKPSHLNNLGRSLLVLYQCRKNVDDLKRSISVREKALLLTPDGHPDRPACLNNLGACLLTRYEDYGDVQDLEKSILTRQAASNLIPDGHPEKSLLLNSLTLSLLERFKCSGDTESSDLSQAISYSSLVAKSLTTSSVDRLQACQLWAQSIRFQQRNLESLLDVYTETVGLLPRVAWIGSSFSDRYHQLLRATDETCDAAAAALDAQRPDLAVEWLEQGRSIMWSQLSHLRTPVDDLRIVSPELADKFEHASRQLERAGSRDHVRPPVLTEGLLGKQAEQHHSLALLREQLLADIRALPDFERFLLPKTIDQLSSLTHSGPVVFLNASKHRCDALVLMTESDRVVHVPLLKIDYDEVAGMQLRLKKLITLRGRSVTHDNDGASRGARLEGLTPDKVFGSILPALWHKVVSPVLDVLGLSTHSNSSRSRIFWCPTGPFTFLPIHAAGMYDTANVGSKLFDVVISSYIPTMGTLELPSKENLQATSRTIRLLTVPQPDTDNHRHLVNVPKEMEVIRNMAKLSPFVEVEDADGTTEGVLAKMKETDWVHFACHGTQDGTRPFDSGFFLADGKRLKLSEIAQLSRPRGGLAFLSACCTATGDEMLSEEAIHIAAGMLLSGYDSVIATMWEIKDHTAPQVAKDVYKRLFEGDKVPDGRQAAEALHHAIEQLRNSREPYLSWVPFIHIGL